MGIGISAWLLAYPDNDLVVALLSNVPTGPIGGATTQAITDAFFAAMRGGTRWLYRPAVSRDQGLTQIVRWAVEEFAREPEDRRHLVLAALRMVGYVPVGSPEALADDSARQAKGAPAQPLSDARID